MLLPHLDLTPLYKKWDFNNAASISFVYGLHSAASVLGNPNVNAAISKTALSVLTCPSDNGAPYYGSPGQYYSISLTEAGGYRSSYDFSTHYAHYYYNHYSQALAPNARPLFGFDARFGLKDVRDGTSNRAYAANRTDCSVEVG